MTRVLIHPAITLSVLIAAGFMLGGDAGAQQNTEDTNPVWSADGMTILFYSYRHGNAQLYALAADGSAERRLTKTDSFEMFPAFAAGDSQIVFVSDRDGERRFQQMEIYVMGTDEQGTQARRLTHDNGLNIFPSVSPDGRQLAYTKAANRFATADIWIMNVDGSGGRQLTDTPQAVDRAPKWSPDGSLIAFDSNRDGDFDVHVMNADGSGVRRLTHGPGYDALPSFSPDGTRVVFESSSDKAPNGMAPPETARICIADLAGSAPSCFKTQTATYDGHASWSPDGEEIVFHTLRHGQYKEIYKMAADGTRLKRLTHTNEGNGSSP